jgi:hypothetical protein
VAGINPHNPAMSEFEGTERRLSLRQADAARAGLYAIHDELDFIKTQIARLPTRKDLVQTAVLAALAGAVLAVAGWASFALL